MTGQPALSRPTASTVDPDGHARRTQAARHLSATLRNLAVLETVIYLELPEADRPGPGALMSQLSDRVARLVSVTPLLLDSGSLRAMMIIQIATETAALAPRSSDPTECVLRALECVEAECAAWAESMSGLPRGLLLSVARTAEALVLALLEAESAEPFEPSRYPAWT